MVPDAGGPQGLKRESQTLGSCRGQGCCPRNCARRAEVPCAIVARREGGTRQRPASQETGRRRDCARASGGVYRCGGGEPAGGLSTLCRWRTRNAPVPISAAVATALILFAAPALADDTPPSREIVVTATRIPTPVLDIPAGVSVIDRQTIEERGYTTLTEALSAVPGVHVSQSGGPGGNASVFVRGTNSNAVLVLRDGMPLNDASDSSGAFNFGVDTLADVERIEVIRGPMAALYGSGAIGGVINLISRRGSRTWLPRHRRTCRRLPEADRGQRQRLRHRRAVRLLGHRAGAGAARLRRHAAAHVDLHRRPRSVQRADRHAQPRLYADRRHAAVAVPARPTRGVRLRCPRQSHLRQQQLHRPGQQPARPHRRHLEAVQRHLRNQCVPRPAAERPVLHRGAQSARSQPAEQQLALPQLPHRRAVEQHGAPVRPDGRAVAVGDRPHLRLRAHRRQHQREGEPVLLRLPFRAVGQGVHDRRCGLCRVADHAAAAPDADRADPPGLGRRATRRSPGGSARCSTCRRSRRASRPPMAPRSARPRCSTASASIPSATSAIPT